MKGQEFGFLKLGLELLDLREVSSREMVFSVDALEDLGEVTDHLHTIIGTDIDTGQYNNRNW